MRMRVYHTYPTFAVPRNTPMVSNKIVDWPSPLLISLAISIMLWIKLTACGMADMLPSENVLRCSSCLTKLHSRVPAHKRIVFWSSMRHLCMSQQHGSKRSHLPGRGTDLYTSKLNPNYRILRIHLSCHCELRFNKSLTARCERSGRKSCRAQWRHV
jgi:hypothetical protein